MSWLDVKKELLYMASAFNRPLSDQVLKWYIDILANKNPDDIIKALRRWAIETKRPEMPTPGQILSLIDPKINFDNEATEAAARIIQAIARFGYSNPLEAKNFIGELGWRVVERYGGWGHLCGKMGTEINEGVFIAHAKALAKVTLERESMGIDDQPPKLGASDPRLKELVSKIKKP